MIGESGGVGSLVYQEQVSRENQIQRDQNANNDTDENSSRQVRTEDVTTFSPAALELSQTAVTAVEENPQVEVDSQSQDAGTSVSGQEGSAPPGQYLNFAA